jgi:hypothetical protein
MPFTAIPSFEKLVTTKEAVDQFCLDCGIDDEQEREYVVQLADTLFDLGETSVERLLAGLRHAMGPDRCIGEQPKC